MATDERFKKKTEQVRILLDDLKKLSRFDNSTVSTLLRIDAVNDRYNPEERLSLAQTFHKDGGAELYMKILTSLSPDGSNVQDSLHRTMEWTVRNLVQYVLTPDLKTTFVDCGGLKFLLSLLMHHACQGLMLRFESRNTLRYAVTTLSNLSMEPELKSCFHQELAADVLACYLDVPDAPCKLSALYALARVSTEQDLDIICNAQGAISLLTDMVNRPSYKNYTVLENILYSSKGLVKTLTMVSITAGIRRKTLQPGAELDEEALQEILPELREKLKVETERRDYTLEWGDIAVHPTRRSVQKWPKARDGLIYVPYKVSVAFYDGDVKKIKEAALEFENKTCVRFIPRSEEADYIYIHARDGNWSFLGRQGGDQAMSLEPGKVTKGTVLHELMHALGFHHEHCRSDRDDHVLVLSHNLRPEWVDDMRKTSNEHNLRTPYDYSSVTHYSMTAGSKDEQSPTLVPRDRSTLRRFGGGHTLSEGDVEKIKKMFDGEPAALSPSNAAPAQMRPETGASAVQRDAGNVPDFKIEDAMWLFKINKKKKEKNEHEFKVECGGVKDCPSAAGVTQWPKSQDGNVYVPYEVSAAFYDYDREAIQRAVEEFEKKTCVRFHPRKRERDFIHIQALDGPLSKNWSYLGKKGGKQDLSLEPGKAIKGIVLHELMHALGFHHEHSRSDRDAHVWVLKENIKPEWRPQIVDIKSTAQDLAAPYNCNSIMHYGMLEGSIDERNPTILPRKPLLMQHMGCSSSLSHGDVVKVQKLYGFEAPPPPPVPVLPAHQRATVAGEDRVQVREDVPLEELVGSLTSKTRKSETERRNTTVVEWEKKTEPLRAVLQQLKKLSSYDSSTVPILQRLLDLLSAQRSKEDRKDMFDAYKEESGDLLRMIIEAPNPDSARQPLLCLVQKISITVSSYNAEEGGQAGVSLKNGDIAGDLSEEVVEWPRNQDGKVYIPYNISIAFNEKDKSEIKQAIEEFTNKTCIRFIQREEAHKDYINVQALEGSWSFLGKKGGAQSVSLEPGKVDRGTVLHELMHALGFHHEHCRSDRDQYIKVHEDNIEEDELGQFKRLECSGCGEDLPYDYLSIMHYGRYASSSDYMSETITPTTAAKAPIGQRSGLSPLDVLRVQRKYQPNLAGVSEDRALKDAVAKTSALCETLEEPPRPTQDVSAQMEIIEQLVMQHLQGLLLEHMEAMKKKKEEEEKRAREKKSCTIQ
ncbi:uncharacterized protein LOC142906670 [Petromyzon marinus]|uniref:uncharacterized protein LOC142906670 n=1 Tax=Petromyzon marinus TaxID=7757 RepID=UPI003F7128A0